MIVLVVAEPSDSSDHLFVHMLSTDIWSTYIRSPRRVQRFSGKHVPKLHQICYTRDESIATNWIEYLDIVLEKEYAKKFGSGWKDNGTIAEAKSVLVTSISTMKLLDEELRKQQHQSKLRLAK